MSRYRKPKRNKTMTAAMALVALFMGMAVGRVGQNIETQPNDTKYQAEEQAQQEDTLQLTDDLEIPVYAGQPYTVIKDNVPDFTEEEKSCTDAFEYSGYTGKMHSDICQCVPANAADRKKRYNRSGAAKWLAYGQI